MSPTRSSSIRQLPRLALGRRADWRIARPNLQKAARGLAWLGPLAIVASVLVSWFAFASAGGNVALGLFVGAASIVLMAWSFVLALRLRWLERFFGGLDSMYQAHRWAGTLAVILMFWHVRVEPEVDNGIRGASKSVADSAEGLAGIAEYMLYGLVAISLLRWVPYRWWRLSHKLLGIPFAFASWHFYTAEKTYANGSSWGWYFGTIMVAGVAAFVARVIGRDMLAQGTRYKVAAVDRQGSTTELRLAPIGRPVTHEIGQFAVIKIQKAGMREPHVFTIASSPHEPELRFFVRDLGDWSAKLQTADVVGAKVFVEAPYGMFEPFAHDGSDPIWIAGGVGITPFLSATNALRAGHVTSDPDQRPPLPHLLYCVPSRSDATAIHELKAAAAEGHIELTVLASDEQNRFSPDRLTALVPPDQLRGAHVAVCGPHGLVEAAGRAARSNGAALVETEAFDIRGGIGPDLSRPIAAITEGPAS